jgi:rod shape-determining protein MreD
MRKNILWFITVVTAALIQTTWPDSLKLQGVLPDLSLLLIVYFAVADGEERAMATGIIGGVYQDVAGNMVLGHHVLCLVLVAYATGRLSTRLITDHPAVKAAMVFMAAMGQGVLFTCIQYVQKPAGGALYPILTSVIPGAFYTAVITPVVFFVLGYLFHHRRSLQGEFV